MASLTANFIVQLMQRRRFLTNAARCADAIRRAEERVRSDPIVLQLEVTSRCNFACSYCIVHNGSQPKPKEDMSLELYSAILDQFPRSFYLQLHGQGEPLLHKQFAEMVRIAESQRRFTTVVTNGSLWTEQKSAELLEAGLDVIAFSLDICTDDQMEEARHGMDAEKVRKNLERVIRIRDQVRPSTAVGVSAVLTRRVYENEELLRSSVQRLDDLGIDFLMVGPLAGTEAYQKRYPPEMREERIVPPVERRLLPFSTRCTVYETPETNFFANRCIWPWGALYINCDGSVAYCSNNHRIKIAERFDEPRLRNLPLFERLRRDFRDGQVPPGCEGCQYLLAYRGGSVAAP